VAHAAVVQEGEVLGLQVRSDGGADLREAGPQQAEPVEEGRGQDEFRVEPGGGGVEEGRGAARQQPVLAGADGAAGQADHTAVAVEQRHGDALPEELLAAGREDPQAAEASRGLRAVRGQGLEQPAVGAAQEPVLRQFVIRKAAALQPGPRLLRALERRVVEAGNLFDEGGAADGGGLLAAVRLVVFSDFLVFLHASRSRPA
jgi:hypothetical protein